MALIGQTKMEILRLLEESPHHGYQLHKKLNITTSTIYRHLEELEEANVVREFETNDNTRIKYALTERGEELLQLLWAE